MTGSDKNKVKDTGSGKGQDKYSPSDDSQKKSRGAIDKGTGRH